MQDLDLAAARCPSCERRQADLLESGARCRHRSGRCSSLVGPRILTIRCYGTGPAGLADLVRSDSSYLMWRAMRHVWRLLAGQRDILVRRGVGVPRDQAEAGLGHARADAVDKGLLP